MARPRKDCEGPSAKRRMEDAFWEALREKPFSKISVADIAQLAQVNRNAFYYHFDNMADLARAAIAGRIPISLFRSVLPSLKQGEAPPLSLLTDPVNEANYAKLWLLAGPHGTYELANIAKSTLIGAWLDEFGLEGDDLNESDLVSLTFVVGGMLNVIGSSDGQEGRAHPLERIWSSPIIAAALSSIPDIFEQAASRIR
ncbi:TetR/AcrR family transcriptional regulator [Eggerthella sinensis]|jgi:AcrR family transcriptional regulator|uniref:TetR/AcrR family transcriptional regulator n=1 Tax=Eggerthella sinensis TaxID=242230 RepID=UPI00266CD53D|nr:TetR/AcrR family transcriptional regulator [Eggerthella sinensis]